jgi:site-specific DNA recombinase
MDGYVRVSRRMGREGPGYISPDVQREAIQRWADYRGVEIAAWHFDEDESGGSQNRPGLRAAMDRIEAGETDGIAVWKIDRFARNVHEAVRDVKRMQSRPGRPAHFASVTEDIDPTGPFGDFILTIMLAVATLQRDSLVEGWKIAKARAMDRDVKIGPTPFGYRRRDDGVLEPHAEHAPIVVEAFRLAAEQGLHATVTYLGGLSIRHEDGARAGRERAWTTSTVRRLVTNRVYLGENRYGDRVERGAHAALVARAVWEAAQPESPKRRRPAQHYPLSGLARCATCGEFLIGGRAGRTSDGRGLRTYRCRASLARWRGEHCPSPVNVLAERLEAHVRTLLAEALQQTWEAQDVAESGLAHAEVELHETETELESVLADVALRRTLGAERFQRLAEANVRAFEDAQSRYRDAAARAARRFTTSEPELVMSASLEELGELARGALDAIYVSRGRGNIERRVRLVVAGAPDDLGMATPEDAEDDRVKS